MSRKKAIARFMGKKNEVIKDKYTCKNCGNKKFIRRARGLVCTKCWSVIENV